MKCVTLMDSVADELVDETLASGGLNAVRMQEAMNDTLRALCNRYAFSWRVSHTPIPVPTVLNQTVYSATDPSGTPIQDFVGVVLDTGSSGTTKPLTEKDLSWYLDHWANVDYIGAGYPNVYTRVGRLLFKVAPKPAATTWYLRVYYVPEWQDITDFNQDITIDLNFPQRVQEALRVGLLARGYRFQREFERAGNCYTLWDDAVEKLVREDKDNPNLSFVWQGFNSADGGMNTGDYWASPFVRR